MDELESLTYLSHEFTGSRNDPSFEAFGLFDSLERKEGWTKAER